MGITTLTSGASVGTGGERRALARIALNLRALLVKDGKRLLQHPGSTLHDTGIEKGLSTSGFGRRVSGAAKGRRIVPSRRACSLTTVIEKDPRQDVQTVSADGESVGQLIDGVILRHQVTQIDERGTLCEILDSRWDVTDSPIVYVYQFTIRPGKAKGWHVHRLHDDRIFISRGELKVVLYDDRLDSPTQGMINEIHRSELRRSLMVIPRGVFHAHVNIGSTDAQLVSMPTRGYDHSSPDVFRLPLDTDAIPYRIEDLPGW